MRISTQWATARELFELLVRIGQTMLAHHHLHGFAQHLQRRQVTLRRDGVERLAVEAAPRGFDRDQRMADGNADVAQRGGSERSRGAEKPKLFCQMLESAMAMPQFASEFSKLTGDLVRHREEPPRPAQPLA